jgi:DNA-binding transcriptional LysR family regulator
MKSIVAGLSMSKLPDLEGLAIFARVAEVRSFAGAAKELDLSTATVSRAVGRLEKRLGARLFNRSSRRLALTDFGLTIAERSSRMVTDAEETENIALAQSSQPRGLIRFAAPMSFGLKWIAPILPQFFELYPEVAIDLHLSDAVVDLIGDGFDCAIRIAVDLDPSLVAKRICNVSPFIVATPVYLARHGRPLRPEDLMDHACLGYAYRAGQPDVWHFANTAGESVVVRPKGPLRATNTEALIPTVLADMAITEMPEFMASEYLVDGRLQTVLDDWTMPRGAAFFVTPAGGPRPARITALADFLTRKLAKPDWRWPR